MWHQNIKNSTIADELQQTKKALLTLFWEVEAWQKMWKVQSVHRMWTSSDVAHAGMPRFPKCRCGGNEGNDEGWELKCK